jgi:hypothetical protein
MLLHSAGDVSWTIQTLLANLFYLMLIALLGQKQIKKPTGQGHGHFEATKGSSNQSNKILSAMFSCFHSDVDRSRIATIMAAENFSLREVIKYGLISLGYVADPEAFRDAENLPFHLWSPLVLPPVLSHADIEEIARKGVMTLLSLGGPES